MPEAAEAEVVNPGDVLDGKYVVERVLGSGGMGMVVAAKHVALGSRVAVKFMLREAMHDPRNVERFKREARLAVQLKSLHAARVIDVGELPNGEPYMVMEYLEGQDLDEVLRRSGPMPVSKAVDYILQASEAIAEAHARGMIHRDIKPKNLFITQSVDGTPLVKVLDFGLGKHLGGDTSKGGRSLTAPAAVFGSPYYMSPEQMRSAKDADTRSDVWSLGVCLYEMLTGRLPFDAPRVAEICAMVLKDPAPPPSRYRPDIPAQLEAVVLRALEKAPARRFQSVAELALALEAFAMEGSGKRILAVMETARRPSLRPPSLAGPLGPLADPRALVKTISSWDSGARTLLAGSPALKRWALIGVAAAAMIVVIGLGVLAAFDRTAKDEKTNATSAIQSEAPAAKVPTTAEPVRATTATSTAASATPPPVASEPVPVLPVRPVLDTTASKPGAAAAVGKPPSHAGATRPPTVATAKPPTTTATATAPAAPKKKTWDTP